jgi:hypothetical protein
VVEVVNLPDNIVRQLSTADLTADQWRNVLRVSIGEGEAAMLGQYAIVDGALRFIPMFPLDPGRSYVVTFRGDAIPDLNVPAPAALSTTVALPARHAESSTIVSQVFPSGSVIPENQLRLYIHFSAPMGRKGGLEYVQLLDDSGQAVVDPFLPLDAEFWNADYTRYTVFFDPGRQKRGILPNQQMGRSLELGKRYTLVVSREWRDANGLPLKEEFRRAFTVGLADEQPLDVTAWQLSSPASGTRDALVVTFPEPLDHGLLLRALGVTGGDGRFLEGDVRVEANESRWSFTPRTLWTTGTYRVVALAMLEDLAGNRIGRAFEVDTFDRADRTTEPERTVIPFEIAAAARE